jgi:hypothetical protein
MLIWTKIGTYDYIIFKNFTLELVWKHKVSTLKKFNLTSLNIVI